MQIWLPITIAIIMIANSWVLKWVDLASKIPETENSASRSKVYIRSYKTGIVIALPLVSVSLHLQESRFQCAPLWTVI